MYLVLSEERQWFGLIIDYFRGLLQACSCQCQLLPRWDECQARYLVWKYKGKKDALGSSSKYGVPVKHAWECDDEEEDGVKDDDEAAEDLDGEGEEDEVKREEL